MKNTRAQYSITPLVECIVRAKTIVPCIETPSADV
jgi:hypothetical protein